MSKEYIDVEGPSAAESLTTVDFLLFSGSLLFL